MIPLIVFFLGLSILSYILLGGADFGGGILELLVDKNRAQAQRDLISKAMAPVWEANHIWLILAIVILMMGFPPVYAAFSIYLHLPVMGLLIGIVLRGCAFAFRYYDTTQEYRHIYTPIFSTASAASAFFLGATGGALILGRIDPSANSFWMLYMAPWINAFAISLGLFTILLFAFLASVYLVGETPDTDLRALFRRRALKLHRSLLIMGALVFVSAEISNFPLISLYFKDPVSLLAFVAAGILWFPFWRYFKQDKNESVFIARALGASIVALVLIGWFGVQYPIIYRTINNVYSFQSVAAPDATLRALLGALIVGSLIIFPALYYLFRIFKRT